MTQYADMGAYIDDLPDDLPKAVIADIVVASAEKPGFHRR
jgi:hypothetical protein